MSTADVALIEREPEEALSLSPTYDPPSCWAHGGTVVLVWTKAWARR